MSTASKKQGEPLIISDIKKGSMAHRYLLCSVLLWVFLYTLYTVYLLITSATLYWTRATWQKRSYLVPPLRLRFFLPPPPSGQGHWSPAISCWPSTTSDWRTAPETMQSRSCSSARSWSSWRYAKTKTTQVHVQVNEQTLSLCVVVSVHVMI